MPKNILIFADGTGQAGGLRPDQRLSNVYKLYRATRSGPDSPIDPSQQIAFYDPGLGTITASGAVQFRLIGTLKSIAGMIVGLGFSRNVIDCYEAILRLYEPGDRIYLFGFSRGGYTARAVANVLNLCGVPTGDGEGNALPQAGRRLRDIATEAVVRVYSHGAGHPRKKFEKEREALAQRFRMKYGAGTDPDRGEVHPEFMGLFDSVAALGLTPFVRVGLSLAAIAAAVLLAWTISRGLEAWRGWDGNWAAAWTFALLVATVIGQYLRSTVRWAPKGVRSRWWPMHLALWSGKYYDRWLDPRIPRVRHALAIDETRRNFSRVEWGNRADANEPLGDQSRLMQRWFAGNHSDIGGSYLEEESRLSDIALAWIAGEATRGPRPVLIDWNKLHLFPDPSGPQHCEHFAFSQAHPWLSRVGFGWPVKIREIADIADLDPSVLARFAVPAVPKCDEHKPYRPASLRQHIKVSQFYGEIAEHA